jgi:hypothetical protein
MREEGFGHRVALLLWFGIGFAWIVTVAFLS